MMTLLRTEQVAERLGYRPQTLAIWRMRRIGPPCIRVGARSIRYDPAAVERWLAQRSVETTPEPQAATK